MPASSIVFTHAGAAELVPQAPPVAGVGEVLLRTRYTLISPGTELALFNGTHVSFADPAARAVKYPIRPGYIAISEVAAAGPEMRTEALRPGDWVLHAGAHTTWSLLQPARDLWVPVNDLATAPRLLFARIAQIAATARHVLRVPPERVLVLGAGLIGLFAAQAFQLGGSRQVVIQDLSRTRLTWARDCGVAHQILGTEPVDDQHSAFFGADGPDVIVEATGLPALVPAALAWVRRGGDVVLLGSPRGNQEIDLYKLVHGKGVALIGAHVGILPVRAAPPAPSQQHLLEWAAEGIRAGRLQTAGLISLELTPLEATGIYPELTRATNRYLGVVIRWF